MMDHFLYGVGLPRHKVTPHYPVRCGGHSRLDLSFFVCYADANKIAPFGASFKEGNRENGAMPLQPPLPYGRLRKQYATEALLWEGVFTG